MSTLYELDGCIVVPFGEETNGVNLAPVREAILQRMETSGLGSVIFDMSGLSVFDRKTFKGIFDTAEMIKMMGGVVVFAGIQPGAATVIVDFGIEVENIPALFSIHEGIRFFRDGRANGGS